MTGVKLYLLVLDSNTWNHLTEYKQMKLNFDLLKSYLQTIQLQFIYIYFFFLLTRNLSR